ncbi:MAG: YqhA family protein [Pseudanabaenales cyanobacterium]|nr:YqhA family protein [Pseudanabaenales cyanobacterium]
MLNAKRMLNAKKIEHYFEVCLWKFRLFTLLPVIFGLLSTLNFFIIGSFEILDTLAYSFELDHFDEYAVTKVITRIIGGIDHYLIGVVLLIFSFGIYEIFISPIDIRSKYQDIKILKISTLDQLKHKILQVIIMVLIISFFKKALSMDVKTTLDLFFIAGSILVVAVSSYLMHLQSHGSHDNGEDDDKRNAHNAHDHNSLRSTDHQPKSAVINRE